MEKQVGEGGREQNVEREREMVGPYFQGDPTMIPKLRGQRSYYILIHFYLKMNKIDLSQFLSFVNG